MATASVNTGTKLLFSADSHVMEPVDLWKNGVPAAMRDQAPVFPPHKVGEGFQSQPGGWDPHERLKEMAQDNVAVEVLYPTLGLGFPAIEDADFRAAIDAAVERVNRDLSAIERVRRFALTADGFTIENGLLTPSMKIRRHMIVDLHGAALETLYGH